MKKLFILLFVSIFRVALSQNSKRIYEIDLLEYPQKIHLAEYQNGQFDGKIISEFKKGRPFKVSWISIQWRKIWPIQEKTIIDTINIDKKVVEKLMNQLKKNDVETITDCSKDTLCNNFRFLDSGSVGFIMNHYGLQVHSFRLVT